MSEVVVRAIRESELERAANLAADVFGRDALAKRNIREDFLNNLPRRPGTKLEHFRAAFIGKKLVSFARMSEYMLHYGRAKLLVTGIGAVCTHPAYRGQGYASAVIHDILTYSAEQGMHMALLNGIPDYYEQFGFMPVWANYTMQAPVERAQKLAQVLKVRDAVPDDLPRMAQLYDQHWGARVTFSRSAALWKWRMWAGSGQTTVVVDENNHVQGYLWHRHREYNANTEVVANTQQAIQSLLIYDSKRFRLNNCDNLTWTVPPDDIIIPFARQMLPITISAHYSPTGNWMGRLIDPSAVVQQLLPEILAQAQNISSKFDANKAIVKVDSEGVEVGMRGNREAHCHLSLRDFVQLLFGSLRPHTLAIRHKLSHDSIELLETLFPPRIAALAPWDWF